MFAGFRLNTNYYLHSFTRPFNVLPTLALGGDKFTRQRILQYLVASDSSRMLASKVAYFRPPVRIILIAAPLDTGGW
jgi:hypothetical protein